MLDFTVFWYINPAPIWDINPVLSKKRKCLTTFTPDRLELYTAAVKTYNDKYKRYDIFINDRGAYQQSGLYDHSRYSLCALDEVGNYSAFWRIFEKLKQAWRKDDT